MKQICTSIKQSQKLLQLGLNPETADMYWRDWKRMTKDISIPHVGAASKDDLPAWSLTTLLSLIGDCKLHTPPTEYGGRYRCYDSKHEFWSDEPVDAVFKMFVHLALEEAAKVLKEFHDNE